MTPMQAKALEAIERLTISGVSPSYSEIATALGLKSKSGPVRLVRSLKRDGFIEAHPHAARSVRVVRPSVTAGVRPELLAALDSYCRGMKIERATALNEALAAYLGFA